MRHDGQVPAVRAAQGRHPLGGAAGVVRVGGADVVGVVHVAQGCEAVAQGGGEGVRTGKVGPPLAVRHPDACDLSDKQQTSLVTAKHTTNMHKTCNKLATNWLPTCNKHATNSPRVDPSMPLSSTAGEGSTVTAAQRLSNRPLAFRTKRGCWAGGSGEVGKGEGSSAVAGEEVLDAGEWTVPTVEPILPPFQPISPLSVVLLLVPPPLSLLLLPVPKGTQPSSAMSCAPLHTPRLKVSRLSRNLSNMLSSAGW